MVTLKRLMNIMALSVLLGAVSTPVMMKAILDGFFSSVGAGVWVAGLATGWQGICKLSEAKAFREASFAAYELALSEKQPAICPSLTDPLFLKPIGYAIAFGVSALAAYEVGKNLQQKPKK